MGSFRPTATSTFHGFLKTFLPTRQPAASKIECPSFRDRKGRFWVSRNGAQFGLQNGMGSAGRKYAPGQIHRSDRMADQGLYSDGELGIPDYGPDVTYQGSGSRWRASGSHLWRPGASTRSTMTTRLPSYCEFITSGYPRSAMRPRDRFPGLASIPSHDVTAALTEVVAWPIGGCYGH
ncbi:MAG: hypothetical protein CM1200mP9_09570 [Gammaproteobacteria bacterium]|nr:MAG: hypothetical protein CM1200mP9_09570 [Gammaproteobacteria bacterium]